MGPADSRDINVLPWITFVGGVRTSVGPKIPGNDEQALTLRGKFLKKWIVRCRVIGIPIPRATQLLGQIVRGHLVQYVSVIDCGRYIDADLGHAGSHRYRLIYIQDYLRFPIRVGPPPGSGAVQRHIIDRNVKRLSCIPKIQLNIAEAVT